MILQSGDIDWTRLMLMPNPEMTSFLDPLRISSKFSLNEFKLYLSLGAATSAIGAKMGSFL